MKSLARSTMSVRGSRTNIGSESRRRRPNSSSESQIDALSYALPPWPEWSDADLNSEKWNVTQPSSPRVIDRRRPSVAATASLLCYQDPMGHAQLPSSLEADSWVRLTSMPNMKVFEEKTEDAKLLDIIPSNTHLLKSELMRWIMAGYMTLYQLGRSRNPELEGQGQAFSVPSTSWKPWHHIYALCKVSKGTAHKPVVNPSGKYVVRLFYMGCWRRITVDDYLPLDKEKRPLLPMTSSGTELWPVLLTKALLKVASLSWNAQAEIRDFSVIASLTGWHAQGRKKSMMFTREGEIEKSSSHIATLVKMIRNSVNFQEDSHSHSQLVPNAPHWGLIVVVDQEMSSTVTLVKDRREEERIRQIKAEWEEGDPGRYKRSHEIRKEFIENNLYCDKFENDFVDMQSESKCGILLKNVSKKESDHVTVFDEKYLTKQFILLRGNILKYNEEYSNTRANFDNIRLQQSLRTKKLSQRMEELTDKSKEMINEAYNKRNDCIANLIEKIEAEKKAAALVQKTLKKGKGGRR